MTSSNRSLGSVLVVDSCGFLGHRIVLQLLEPNCAPPLSVQDIKTHQSQLPNFSYHQADIPCLADIKSAIDQLRPDVISHTASSTIFAHNLDPFLKVNAEGTRNLLEAAQEAGCVKAFIYTSSASVLNDSVFDQYNVDDTWPVLYNMRTPKHWQKT